MTRREKQQKEAMRRMRLLNIDPAIIRRFKETGEVLAYDSSTGEPAPISKFTKRQIRKLEQRYGFLVYLDVSHVEYTGIYEELFIVSTDEDRWEMQLTDLYKGYTLAYSYNSSFPNESKIQKIAFLQTKNGGISYLPRLKYWEKGTPIDMCDRQGIKTAVELHFPDTFSAKAWKMLNHWYQEAYLFSYKSWYVLTNGMMDLTYDEEDGFYYARWYGKSLDDLERWLEKQAGIRDEYTRYATD